MRIETENFDPTTSSEATEEQLLKNYGNFELLNAIVERGTRFFLFPRG